jgi:NTP pyrophosphatase (non-canonical NTP hydrolase)
MEKQTLDKKARITINEIQEWEKSFVKKKGILEQEEAATKIAICKLAEEVGEVAKALLESKWDEIQAEVADVIVFACKIANIAEKFHNSENLTSVIRKKLGYCEGRTYDSASKKFDKPKNEEFK